MMNGRGKSDSAIVAANKAGQPAAESVEPRAEAEGNANQQSTRARCGQGRSAGDDPSVASLRVQSLMARGGTSPSQGWKAALAFCMEPLTRALLNGRGN